MDVNLILILVVLTNLKLLASSRLGAAIWVVAAQGIVLGLLPVLAHSDALTIRFVLLSVSSLAIKGVVFPWLLWRAVREADMSRDVQPYVGYIASILIGLLALAVSFGLGARLPVTPAIASPLVVPIALFSIFSGLFLIIARKRAVTQVIGFIALENGVFTFGTGVTGQASLLIEAGVLLDLFVAVFVMGIMIFHINREFDHLETDRLSTLKD